MPKSKIIIDIDLMKLVGAHLIESSRTGKPAFVLDVEGSRVTMRGDNKGKRTPELWLRIEAVESPNMTNENTHFVTEPLTNDELKQGLRSKLIGAARLYIIATQQPANA